MQAKYSTGQFCTWSAATANGAYSSGVAVLQVNLAGGSSPMPGVQCPNATATYTGSCSNGVLILSGPNGSALRGAVLGNTIGLNGQDINYDQWAMTFGPGYGKKKS